MMPRLHFSAREAVSQAIEELGLGRFFVTCRLRLDRSAATRGWARGGHPGRDVHPGRPRRRAGLLRRRPTSGPAGTSDDRRPLPPRTTNPSRSARLSSGSLIEILEPNQIVAKLMACDTKLNPNPGLRQWKDGKLVPLAAVPVGADGTFGNDEQGRPKRALLVVHGTFSSSDAIFGQLVKVEQDNHPSPGRRRNTTSSWHSIIRPWPSARC